MEADTYTHIKRTVKTLLDIDLSGYKDVQMKRRLDSWLTRRGAASWHEYFNRVRTDAAELDRFRDFFTINVSEFFRDPERWRELRDRVLPELLAANPRSLRVWSAGCSIGPEPYSLAILLDDLSRHKRHRLLATDLDRGALAKARARGPFSADDIRGVTPTQRATHFAPGGPPFFVAPSLAERVDFRELNLLAESFESDFDLIVCRNVVIYFTNEAKVMLFQKFHAALRPGGVLFVGATEIIPRPQEIGFEAHGLSFYRRCDKWRLESAEKPAHRAVLGAEPSMVSPPRTAAGALFQQSPSG